jgi:hypothetical protein
MSLALCLCYGRGADEAERHVIKGSISFVFLQ